MLSVVWEIDLRPWSLLGDESHAIPPLPMSMTLRQRNAESTKRSRQLQSVLALQWIPKLVPFGSDSLVYRQDPVATRALFNAIIVTEAVSKTITRLAILVSNGDCMEVTKLAHTVFKADCKSKPRDETGDMLKLMFLMKLSTDVTTAIDGYLIDAHWQLIDMVS